MKDFQKGDTDGMWEFYPLRFFKHLDGWHITLFELISFRTCRAWVLISLTYTSGAGLKLEGGFVED